MMAPTLLKFGLLLLAQLHLTWALVPRASATSSLALDEQEKSRFAANCIGFQVAQLHDDCTKFGIDRGVFLSLNPGINLDCTNLIAGLPYCTKKLDSSSSSSIDTSAKTTLATATAMPPMTTMTTVTKAATTSSENKMTGTSTAATSLRTHPGYPTNCKEHEHVQPSDTCVSIAVRGKTTPGEIMNLNEVGANCEKLFLDYDVCVRV